ncbi:hypothetical protein LCL95_00450 [Bacillus timonensis]|nr:hypothetical protein [Bacillus timonensis]
MVIQSNMSPNEIVNIWKETNRIFQEFQIETTTTVPLIQLVSSNKLANLLDELNQEIGSSQITCIEGG